MQRVKLCCCNHSISSPVELPIESDNQEVLIGGNCIDASNLDELKEKIIQDFLTIVNKLECGIQPDLEFLLQEISIVYIKNE